MHDIYMCLDVASLLRKDLLQAQTHQFAFVLKGVQDLQSRSFPVPVMVKRISILEFNTVYKQTHFVRNKEFKEAVDEIQGPMRQIFVEFLDMSCTAEVSGFLLYKEVGGVLKYVLLDGVLHLVKAGDETGNCNGFGLIQWSIRLILSVTLVFEVCELGLGEGNLSLSPAGLDGKFSQAFGKHDAGEEVKKLKFNI
ncbi:hypothetical protein L2E82_17385 [Cichorium intybus]|uniref:Uncharacterized protein n=1 Tax=Cichorium intybus TaxID=13427 RepID=A0ACB9F9D3_CICIN|nr:hypothetical protein L2E82_17385 [Cichorium intybus]